MARTVYVTTGTLRLLKMLSVGKSISAILEEALEEAVDAGLYTDIPFYEERVARISVSEKVWYLVNRLRMDLGYNNQRELIFYVVAGYVAAMIGENCVRKILSLEV